MILPFKIAQAFIQEIDHHFLTHYSNEQSPQFYLREANHHMADAFNVSWTCYSPFSSGSPGGSFISESKPVIEAEMPDYVKEMTNLSNFLSDNFQLKNPSIENIIQKSSFTVQEEIDYYGGIRLSYKKSMSFKSLAEHLKEILDIEPNAKKIDFDKFLIAHSKIVPKMNFEQYQLLKLYENLDLYIHEDLTPTKKPKL